MGVGLSRRAAKDLCGLGSHSDLDRIEKTDTRGQSRALPQTARYCRFGSEPDALPLPDDAFAEKHELLKKRDVLRERAAEHAVEADQTGRLLICFPSCLGGGCSWDSRYLVTQAGGGATGAGNMTNLGGVSLNAQMMEASGAGRAQARIGVIKSVLTDRGVDVPAAD